MYTLGVILAPNLFAAFCLVMLIAPQASANLVGLRVFREGLYGFPDPPPDEPRWIYRVYAEFTEPTDSVHTWGIGSFLGPGQIRNITAARVPGTGFINIPDDNTGNLAPNNPLTVRDWDTYMTIGVVYGSLGPSGIDATQLGPGTPTFISGGTSLWTGPVGYVSLSPTSSPQGNANYWMLGNDTDKRVLLMQLVVNAGEHVEGEIGLLTRTQAGAMFTQGLTFSSVPEPASVSILLLSALCMRRRR